MTMGVTVKVTELTISTNGVGKPDKNPQFIENRVYQGSSGRVYPYVVIETISDEGKDQDYKSVILKSQYLEVTVPPEPGGRIQYARDKTDDYDFVYRNRVIKPALVGLTGLWISSGIEFNWPQHQRPSTFLSVDCTFKGLPDGGKAVVCHDAVGLYVELMTGVFSENQPGFTWLKPCKQVGLVRNVSADTALSLEVGPEQIFGAAGEHEGIEAQGLKAGQGRVTVYATRVQENARVQLVADDGSIPYQWQGADRSERFAANEELLLTGLRLEHYRYATYRPDPYYLERLKRDPGDACISNACGRLLLRCGDFAAGEQHLDDHVGTGCFAVFLPDLLTFDAGYARMNRVRCLYLMALARIGTGRINQAREYLKQVLELDAGHIQTGLFSDELDHRAILIGRKA